MALNDYNILLVGPALALFALAALRPVAAIVFLPCGSVLFYFVCQVVGYEPSPAVVGGVMSILGGGAFLGSMIAHRWRIYRIGLFGASAVAFFAIWITRWVQHPAASGVLSERVFYWFLVFVFLPFVWAIFFAASHGKEIEEHTLRYSMASLIVVIVSWLVFRTNFEQEFAGKWNPIRQLSSGATAIILALGILVYLNRRWTAWHAEKSWHVILYPGAGLVVIALLGQRGPFAFLLATAILGLTLTLFRAQRRIKRALSLIAVLIIGVGMGYRVFQLDLEVRSLRAESYSLEHQSTKARLEIYEVACRAFWEKPVLGWGGGMVGRPVAGHGWGYSHNLFLDVLVETGLVGFVPFLLCGWALVRATWRSWRSVVSSRAMLAILLVVVFSFAEALVAGHIAGNRVLWFFLAVFYGQVRRASAANGATALAFRKNSGA